MNMEIRSSKETLIPGGATHWQYALVNPFYKKDDDKWFQFISEDNEWAKVDIPFNVKIKGIFRDEPKLILPAFDTSSLETIQTCLGEGWLLGKDMFGGFVVELKVNDKGYTPLTFQLQDIRK
jgi:hypothetical protein